jgi:hypothetical protein
MAARKTFFCYILFLAFGLNSIAQTNFAKGYVITLNSDTLHGEINNVSAYQNSMYCEFRKEGSQTVHKYLPGEIASYKFQDGKYYESYEIQKKTVFLENLFNGKVDVYFWRDNLATDHYYISKDTLGLTELKYGEFEKMVRGKRMAYNITEYKTTLSTYMSDCPQLRSRIQSMHDPNATNLISLAHDYHSITSTVDEGIAYEKKTPHKIKMNVGTGMMYFTYDDATYETKGWHPVFGYDFYFQQAQNNEKLYVGLGFHTTPALYPKESAGSGHKNMYYVTLPLSINYFHPKQGLSPYFGYAFDLNHYAGTQSLMVGMNYRIHKFSIMLVSKMGTSLIIFPNSGTIQLEASFDLR